MKTLFILNGPPCGHSGLLNRVRKFDSCRGHSRSRAWKGPSY